MKTRSMKTMPMLILCLMFNLIAFGQPSSTDTVVITRDQQKTCIKCLINEPIKDSIIVSKDSIIVLQRNFIVTSEEYVEKLDSALSESISDLKDMKKKRNNAVKLGILSTIFAVIITLIL